ncbi:hypothetical protein NDU88_001241 [Pleurodeles waltl]|uniref:Uncharacterized protein n=1 Tax=Pleurodeles waltl TaxID=8319 RepID=A0AAV7TI40_PLEWA|nr:hypothetical protein NDU88_001241 [Pleurodeles waltl]
MLSNAGLQHWEAAELHNLGTVFDDAVLLTLDQLRADWGIPAGHFFAYGRLLAALNELWHITDTEPTQHPPIHTLYVMGSVLRLITWPTRALAHTARDSLLSTYRR